MDFTNLKNYMDRLVSEYKVPGVDCIVCKDHEQVFRYFAGKSDIENDRDMNGNELYLIFSMTKMITCTAVLQLMEKGMILARDPISKYLPEFSKMKLSSEALNTENAAKIATGGSMGEATSQAFDGYAKTPITIEHLLTMTAGFNYDLKAPYITEALAEGRTSTRELVRALAETPLGFEPGTRYRYSLCHDILAGLVEVVSGKTFGEYLKENIFDVLGMKETFFGLPKDEAGLSRMAARYGRDKDGNPIRWELKCDYNLSDKYESGGAGLTSSTEDYAIFLDAIANEGVGANGRRILSAASVRLMSVNHLTAQALADFQAGHIGKGYGYGYAVRVHYDRSQSGSLTAEGEFGWDGAAGGLSLVDTKNKLCLVYFQHQHAWDSRIHREMSNILYSCIE